MAYIARTDGTQEEIDPAAVTLKRAQEIVGGYVERIHALAQPKLILLTDEEGRLKGKPVNLHGCDLYGGMIVGDIIVMTRAEGRKWR